MLLAHHIHFDHALSLLIFSAGFALVLVDVRARERRSERSAQLQHAAYELGRQVALDRTPTSA